MGYYTDYNLTDILDRDSKESVMDKVLPHIQGLMKWLDAERNAYKKENNELLSWGLDEEWLPLRWWDLNGLFTNERLNSKWYKDERDWAEFSIIYPNLIFYINGKGEESGDLWHMIVCDGEHQKEWAPEPMLPELNYNAISKRKEQ